MNLIDYVKFLSYNTSGKTKKFYDYLLEKGKLFIGFTEIENYIDINFYKKIIRPKLK